MKCLGISSAMSASAMGASVVNDDDILAEFSVSGREAKAENLVSMVDAVLKKAGLKISDMEGIAVTKGPGSYSGLRGGLAVAKSIAGALTIPVAGVSTIEAVAYNFTDSCATVAVIIHACRDEYNMALFSSGAEGIKRLTEDTVIKLSGVSRFFSKIKGGMILASEERVYEEVIKNGVCPGIRPCEPKNLVPWAVNVARIGAKKFGSGIKEDYLSMVPDYSHDPNIREFGKH